MRQKTGLIVSLTAFLFGGASNLTAADQLSAQAITQINAIQLEKASWTPAQQKIDSNLLREMKKELDMSFAAGFPDVISNIQIDPSGLTLVDIKAEVSDELLTTIESLGGKVVNSFEKFDAIRAYVPIEYLEELASEDAVKSVRSADTFMLNKENTSEGVVAHKADIARTTYSVDGTGVKVGVLSDSADELSTLQASGDLPASVTVLSDTNGTSEGTAMLEIVYDVAPGADLYFATAYGGEAQFAQNILDLRTAGCDVIVDDVSYFLEPVFQDGIIAQAVETVVADGAVYFSSAGNSGNLNDGQSGVWEGDYSEASTIPSGLSDYSFITSVHDFGGDVNYNTLTYDSGNPIILQWADAWGESGNDYDLYLLDSSLSTLYAYSANSQDGDDDPWEGFSLGGSYSGYKLVISKYSGDDRYLYLTTNRGRLSNGTDGQTCGHSAATAAFSVAAVDASDGDVFSTSDSVEYFSSDGFRRVFFEADGTPITLGDFSSTGGELRMKPDIAAADGVSCATTGFDSFYGTSAAAPHAAAIAALMIENGITTPSQIREAITNSCWDIEASGFDRDSGYGILNAADAVGYAIILSDPVSNAVISIAGSTLQIDFQGYAGQSFELMSSPSLNPASWTSETNLTLDGYGEASFSESIPSDTEMFYKVAE